MDWSVIGELLTRERRSEQPALSVPRSGRTMSYHDFLTNAYKSANVLRYLGVSDDATVAIDPTADPVAVLAFLGAAQLGATVEFDPHVDARLTLVPVADEADYDLQPGQKLAVYGGSPALPRTTHWETEVWSENPGTPTITVDPESTVLRADGVSYSHQSIRSAADRVVDAVALDAGSRLAIRVPLSSPASIAAIAAALSVGATAIVTDEPTDVAADAAIVAAGSTPAESPSLAADAVLFE